MPNDDFNLEKINISYVNITQVSKSLKMTSVVRGGSVLRCSVSHDADQGSNLRLFFLLFLKFMIYHYIHL